MKLSKAFGPQRSNSSSSLPTLASRERSLCTDKGTTATVMSELLKLRDNYLYLSDTFHLDQSDIATLIDYVAN